MGDDNLRTLEEIEKELEEPEHDKIEKFAKMSDDQKSLLIRIPQEIRNKFNMKAGDKIKFSGIFEKKKEPKLEIEFVKC